jgi:GH3 auxin-responsive promoter
MKDHVRVSKAARQAAIDHFLGQQSTAAKTQAILLDTIVRRNRDTAFGIEHGFGNIRGVADYRRQVPVQQWTAISPYIDQVVQGRPDILTSEPPVLYHWTTGTTGTPKLIPFTRSCAAAAKHSLRIWLYMALQDNPRMLDGRIFALLNPGIDGYTETQVPYGSVSGSLYFRLPGFLRRAYSNSYDVYHIEDLQARFYTLLRFALDRNCSWAVTGNPSGLRTMFEMADRMSELLIKDIHDGTLSARFQVPAHIRTAAINDLAPNPGRARMLAKAKEQNGTIRPVDYWPDLELIGCWLGGSMGHFAPSLREWCGDKFLFRDIGYMASEGIFSIPLGNGTPDSALALHSAFFEFIPEPDFGREDAPVLLAHELEAGQNYQVVVTTTAGLYRYVINDIVRATEMVDGAPRIRFLYKGDNVQNIQGEQVSIDHVMAAMSATIGVLGVSLRHFQIVADQANRHYIVHVEPTNPIPTPALHALLSGFDSELGKQNPNYEFFRTRQHLKPPTLRLMQDGWFARIVADHGGQGYRAAQFKPVVLASAAQHAEMAETEIALEDQPLDA